jgi:choline dehydrogenase-like flavoprotein
MHTHCVIGSGPAGVATASALLARGANVLMLDAGIELEPDRAQIVRDLSQRKPADWQRAQIAKVHGDSTADMKGLPHKNLFGSNFLYRESEEKTPWRQGSSDIRPSLALGGLSNVWGATLLPLRDEDISDWPIQRSDLDEHYRAVTEITGLAARHDSLEELFPIHARNPIPLKPSRQAAQVLENLERRRDVLRTRGWHFGQSRMAVRATDSNRGIGCVYCGHCLTGCVYGCIYNAAYTVQELRQNKNFRYERDVIVTRLKENSGTVPSKHLIARAARRFHSRRSVFTWAREWCRRRKLFYARRMRLNSH